MKIIGEFKKFINRGNIVDMAVGVIVGSSFTAVVNGLSNNILKPLINALLYVLLGGESIEEIYSIIIPAYTTNEVGEQVLDLASSIYIDWGAFIHAIINFGLVAVVLFVIVKVVNMVRDKQKKAIQDILDDFPTKEERREMKKMKLNYKDEKVLAQFRKDKAAAAKAEAEEKARQERLANPTTEDLLKEILAVLKSEKEQPH
ncbi:MAG: large conductance mechanosensitive channel protein MscL [Firmicutes bacterium]|nr:large conductance mechanosensitive channel protein MscL [Bacillota bacterium]